VIRSKKVEVEKEKSRENILELLIRELKDHRRGQGKRHPIQIVVIIILMGIMSGAKSERGIVRFARNNKEDLIELLEIERKEVPSRYVIRDVIRQIAFDELEEIFYKWSKQHIEIEDGEWINIDGKAIRGTMTNKGTSQQDFVSLVSVFVSKKRQVLSVGKINTKKENEIPTVKELIQLLDLQGVTFTLDALHCQVETVKTIVESGNDYVIGVKENQPKLLEQIKKT
jgi:hypothetical protein